MKNEIKKVAVVTGASRGIGYCVARGLAVDGYNVVIIARSEDKLKTLADEIVSHGVDVKIIATDITQHATLTKALAEVINQWGRVDVLVNNAGIFQHGTLDATLDDYQHLLDVNFKSQLVMIQSILPSMLKRKYGYIFNIASIAGKVGYAGLGAYGSSKFALVGLNESLYNEFSTQGIKVTAICPGYVATDMAKGASITEAQMVQPSDVLNTIRWLLHLSPSAYVKEVILNTAT